jgi:hypothetical protein
MRAYVVRIIEDHDLVGIFVATNRFQLQMLVDECTDIDECDFAPLPAGGIYWDVPAVQIPVPEGEADDSPDIDPSAAPTVPWSKLTASDSWFRALYEPIRRWRPLFQEGDVFVELEMDRADEAAARPRKTKKKWRHLRVVK